MNAPHRIRATTRVVIALVAGVSLCGTVIVAPAAAAAAGRTAPAAPSLLVSADGENFGTHLDGGLFDGLGLLVPTGEVAATLWIRNPTTDAAELRVSTRNVRLSDGSFGDGVTLTVWNSGTGDTHADSLRAVAACGIVVPAQTVEAGETVAMTLTFAMADLPESVSQGESGGLDLLVAMRSAGASPYPRSACDDDGVLVPSVAESAPVAGPSALAESGAAGVALLWPVGGVLVGLGLFLVAGRRRERVS